MKVHHLDCGPMQPPVVGHLVCHVLLCETAGGLVLVDSGMGLADIAEPARRLGLLRHLLQPSSDPLTTAVRQVEALGFEATDVRDIILTHLDLDHVGGIADFPAARIHVTAIEHAAATAPTLRERSRYRRVQWDHQPIFVTYAEPGEPWRGFAAAQPLDGLDARFALVPLPGHSRGHACVAVDTEDRGWLLHAGDAVFDGSMLGGASAPRRALRAFERVVAFDLAQVRANHERLAELQAREGAAVHVLPAHDPTQLERARAAALNN